MSEPPARPSHKRIQTHVNRGLAWIGIASSLVGVLDVVATIVIVNLWISPDEYGIATNAVWLFPLLDQATDLGLSAAVIQKEDHSESKISTVFWINVAVGGLLFLLAAGAAPLLAHIYKHDIIGWMLLAYSTKLLFQNVYAIPATLMKRELRFKELSVVRILANIAEFLGKVGFAAAGFGIWCFVLGPLCRVAVTAVGVQLRHPWRPKLLMRFSDAREYVSFGLKSSGSQVLFYFYTNIDYPIVGYYFGPLALGLYRLAYEIVLEPVRIISNVVVDVAFPAFARLQHAPERLAGQLVSFTKLNLIAVGAYSAVVFVAATDIVATVVPSYATIYELDIATWSFTAVPSGTDLGVRILVAVAVLRSLSFVIPPLLDGVGRPDRTFAYMSTAAIAMPILFMTSAVVLGDSLGWQSVAVGWAVGYPIAFAVLVYLAIYTLRWKATAYLRSVAGVGMCMVAAGLTAWLVHYLLASASALLRLGVTAVVVVLVAGITLAYSQNLTLRTAARALKGEADNDAA